MQVNSMALLEFRDPWMPFRIINVASLTAFSAAVDNIVKISSWLLASLETTALPKNREEEAAKARARHYEFRKLTVYIFTWQTDPGDEDVRISLFIAQSFHRLQISRPVRRIYPEEQANQ